MSLQILSIADINARIEALNGTPVRTWGKVKYIEHEQGVASITYNSSTLIIQTHLVLQFDGQIGDVGQFIGDIEDGVLLLKSFRRVHRLDIDLFETALEQRNKYLNNLNTATAGSSLLG